MTFQSFEIYQPFLSEALHESMKLLGIFVKEG